MRTWGLAFWCLLLAVGAYLWWIVAIAEDREGNDLDAIVAAGLFWSSFVISLGLFGLGAVRTIRSRRARIRKDVTGSD